MDMRDQILWIKNALSEQQCAELISEYEQRSAHSEIERCLHANTGRLQASTFRKVMLAENSENWHTVFSATESAIQQWIQHLSEFGAFHLPALRVLLKCSHQYRLMKYLPGGWIHPHIDGNPYINASCTFQLNDEFEGGEFWFWNGQHRIRMRRGDALIFPAGPFWVHEVRNITEGVRYSVNSFILSASPQLFESSEAAMSQSLVGMKTYQS